MVQMIKFEDADSLLDWIELAEHLADCHQLGRAKLSDQVISQGEDTLLSRAAWIGRMGSLVKTALVIPSNKGRGVPTTNGAVNLFDRHSGELTALIDFRLVTKWKTAADSLLAARKLARSRASHILIVGAGSVGCSLIEAYGAAFPDASFKIWNRTPSRACSVAASYKNQFDIYPIANLATYVPECDIITCATMSSEPLLQGDWLSPGSHVDLVGAFRSDMREVDNVAISRARIFVDCFETTIDTIGEIKIPLAQGIIKRSAVLADFYDLPTGKFTRNHPDEITLFKNGGGAHLDLMTAHYIVSKWQQAQAN